MLYSFLLILAIVGTLCIGVNWISSLDFLSHFQFWITLLLIFGFLLSIFSKKRWITLWLLVVSFYHLWVVFPYLPRPEHSGDTVSKKEPTLSILQYNMNANNNEYASIIEQLKRIDPDLLVICEANNHILDRIEHLHAKYPYRIEAGRWPNSRLFDASGTILWSKHPFVSEETVTLDKGYIQLLRTTVEYRETPIEVFALHLPSPVNSLQSRRRNEGIREVADLVKGHENALVIGDFNNTLWSAATRDFMKTTHLRSIYRYEGIKPTWPSALYPFGVCIDHIFYSDQWQPVEVSSLDDCGSDHRMLVAKLYLNQ